MDHYAQYAVPGAAAPPYDQIFGEADDEDEAAVPPTTKALLIGIKEAENRASNLRAQLAEAQSRDMAQFVAAVQEGADARVLPLREVVTALAGLLPAAQPQSAPKRARKPRKAAEGAAATGGKRRVWRDPEGRGEYRGGKPPTWMSDAMAAAGIERTRDYCKAHMTLVG
jgi:hypothetical protein